jgi:Fe2+ or Zn2+ uptake regulation protein
MTEKTKILDKLRTDGYRLTRARQAIIDIFLKSPVPLSVPELMTGLKKRKLPVNKTTVYREVDFLKAREMVREIQLGDGLRRYELWSGGHHHHLVCVRCNHIECLELEECLGAMEKKITKDKNFKLIEHSLEFFGLCAVCQ